MAPVGNCCSHPVTQSLVGQLKTQRRRSWQAGTGVQACKAEQQLVSAHWSHSEALGSATQVPTSASAPGPAAPPAPPTTGGLQRAPSTGSQSPSGGGRDSLDVQAATVAHTAVETTPATTRAFTRPTSHVRRTPPRRAYALGPLARAPWPRPGRRECRQTFVEARRVPLRRGRAEPERMGPLERRLGERRRRGCDRSPEVFLVARRDLAAQDTSL